DDGCKPGEADLCRPAHRAVIGLPAMVSIAPPPEPDSGDPCAGLTRYGVGAPCCCCCSCFFSSCLIFACITCFLHAGDKSSLCSLRQAICAPPPGSTSGHRRAASAMHGFSCACPSAVAPRLAATTTAAKMSLVCMRFLLARRTCSRSAKKLRG